MTVIHMIDDVVRIPKITIIDNYDKHETYVGWDQHDELEIDDKTGGLHYRNLQNCEGTSKYKDKTDSEGYSFGKIEYINFLQLLDMQAEHLKCKDDGEYQILKEKIIEYFSEKQKELEEERQKMFEKTFKFIKSDEYDPSEFDPDWDKI